MTNEMKPFDEQKAEIEIFVAPMRAIKVIDEKSLAFAQSAGSNIKQFMKRVEAIRDSAVRPHNEQVKRINAYAKEIVKPLDEIESLLKKELLGYHKVLQIEKEKELRKIEAEKQVAIAKARAELKAKQEEQELESMFDEAPDIKKNELVVRAEASRLETEILADESSKVEALSSMRVSGSRQVWSFEIKNPNEVPREFLEIDETKIRKAVAAGAREIAGVKIFQETKIALGGR